MTNTEEFIVYSNSRNGLGIRILGAKRATAKSGVFIKQILDDGLAQKDGRLKVGDQILSINDESVIGVNREQAVNILRSAASTNQVRLRIKHFSPTLSSSEFQKLLYEDKSTDDDERINQTTDQIRTRKSSRKHQPTPNHFLNSSLEPQTSNQSTMKSLNISFDALQALLNSKFKLIDLVDLLKKTSPNLFPRDQKKEIHFIEQLTQTNPDGRITLKDFERQSSIILGERINLLTPFYSSTNNHSNENEIINELRREIASCRLTIDELQTKVSTCEKSQRLSNEIEYEYEDLLKFVYEQLRLNKINEHNQLKQLKKNDQLIRKLFNYLSSYVNKPDDEHILAQLKYEYDQQQKTLSYSIDSNNKDQQRF